jgi:hypothetical protein
LSTAVRVEPNYPLYLNAEGTVLGVGDASDGIDQRPTIAPGAQGVILDTTGDPALATATSIRGLDPSGRRVSPRGPRLSLKSARFDRDRCSLRLDARNLGDRPVWSSTITAVWNFTATEVLDAEVVPLSRPIAARGSIGSTFELKERYCRARSVDFYVTPSLSEMDPALLGRATTRLRALAR